MLILTAIEATRLRLTLLVYSSKRYTPCSLLLLEATVQVYIGTAKALVITHK